MWPAAYSSLVRTSRTIFFLSARSFSNSSTPTFLNGLISFFSAAGVCFRHRLWNVLVLSGSGERAAGFGGDLCVRRSLPAFSPRSEPIYQEESSASFISRVRLVGTDERLLLKESTGNCATFPFQQI